MNKRTFIFTLICLTATISFSALAAESSVTKQVTVNGECNHQVSPDRGSIILTVEFQNMDLTKATKQTKQSYARVSSAIKKLKLDDVNMRTSEYSVNEVTAWENKKKVNKGFRARMGLWISTSEIDRMGELIAIASKEKVQDVQSLQTYLSEEKQLLEEIACLEDAARNARQKAQKLASALNAKLGDVTTIAETGKTMPRWPQQTAMRNMYAAEAMSMSESVPQVEPGQQNLSLSVQVTFSLQ